MNINFYFLVKLLVRVIIEIVEDSSI